MSPAHRRHLCIAVCRRRKQAHFSVARIHPGVLNHDRHVRFKNRRIIGVARNDRRLFKIIEAQMQRAPRSDCNPIRADRLAIGQEYGDRDVRVPIAGIEDAGGLMRDQGVIGERTLRRNISFGNGPTLTADRFHCRLPARPPIRRVAAEEPSRYDLVPAWFPGGNLLSLSALIARGDRHVCVVASC